MKNEPTKTAATALRGNVGKVQLFALGFGSIIGSAWCVLVGIWLGEAGPGGAIVGFVAGGAVMLAVGACYAELTARLPRTGGEFSFCLAILGPRVAFFVGWFIVLCWILVTIFEGIAIAWFLSIMVPRWADSALYGAFGTQVTRNQILVGATGALLVAAVNRRGTNLMASFHSVLTYTFLGGALLMLGVMAAYGSTANMQPFFPATAKAIWWKGAAHIFANSVFFLTGFQAVAQMVEERAGSVTLLSVAHAMIAAIGAAAVFYCVVILCVSAVSPWPALAGAELGFVSATRALPFGDTLVNVVLSLVVISLLKTWNGIFMMSVRTLLGLARAGLLPTQLGVTHARSGVPRRLIYLTATLNILGLFLGRGAIAPMLDIMTISLVFGYMVCCIALLLLRRQTAACADYRVPGGSATIWFAICGAGLMAVVALVSPVIAAGSVPITYAIIPVWAFAGFLLLQRA